MILGKTRLRITGNEKGATTVEFAIVAILFFTVLFSIVDFALMAFVNLTMQHAVREGTRFAITGDTEGAEADSDARYDDNERFRAMLAKIEDSSLGFYSVVLDPGEDIIVENTNQEGYTAEGEDDEGTYNYYYPGGAGEIIVLKLNCTWPLLTPLIKPFFTDGEYNFTVASTMRNELFDD